MPDIKIKAQDGGTFTGYMALPLDTAKHPGIIVIQEIFGVNHGLRAMCDAWAEQGYVALCPDLFWRQEPGIQLSDRTPEEWARAFQLYQGFDVKFGVADLQAATATLRNYPACNGRVGAVGFCLGGKLAYLMAAQTDIDASVGYYGVGIENDLDLAAQIRNPLMLHIAERDKFVPEEAQEKIKDALAHHPKIAIHTYADQDHAFSRVGGQHYDQEAAELAHERTGAFFKKTIG